ncbi:porin [Kushneria sp. AK178]
MTFNQKGITLSLCLSSLFVAQQASAVILYESPDDRLEFSGRLAAASTWVDDVHDDHDPTNFGSRVRLIHEHNFEAGWSSILRTEWGFNPWFETGSDEHYKRLQYAGLSNSQYGTILIGKQYSLWYDMVGVWTDWFWINGAAAQGSFSGRNSDGGFEGNGRPDRAISYQNSWGDWSFGVLYQTERDDSHSDNAPIYGNIGGQQVVTGFEQRDTGVERNYTGQAALNWLPSETLSLGLAYTHSSITDHDDDSNRHPDVNATLLGARWTPGNWYFAAMAGDYRNLERNSKFEGLPDNGAVEHARGYELVALYNLRGYTPGSVQIYGGLNRLEDRDSDARNANYIAGVAWLLANDNLVLALERSEDDSKDADGSSIGNDNTAILVRYDF